MKKALLILVPVGVLLLWAFVPAKERPVWRENVQLDFLGFTNPVAGAAEIHAFFGFRGSKVSPYSWEVLEISHQQNGRWQRESPAVHFPKLYYANAAPKGFMMGASVPVSATNVPLRVVMELGENGPVAVQANRPPSGWWGQFYQKWRYRYKQWLHPNNPARWNPGNPPVPVCRRTNEFNFPKR